MDAQVELPRLPVENFDVNFGLHFNAGYTSSSVGDSLTVTPEEDRSIHIDPDNSPPESIRTAESKHGRSIPSPTHCSSISEPIIIQPVLSVDLPEQAAQDMALESHITTYSAPWIESFEADSEDESFQGTINSPVTSRRFLPLLTYQDSPLTDTHAKSPSVTSSSHSAPTDIDIPIPPSPKPYRRPNPLKRAGSTYHLSPITLDEQLGLEPRSQSLPPSPHRHGSPSSNIHIQAPSNSSPTYSSSHSWSHEGHLSPLRLRSPRSAPVSQTAAFHHPVGQAPLPATRTEGNFDFTTIDQRPIQQRISTIPIWDGLLLPEVEHSPPEVMLSTSAQHHFGHNSPAAQRPVSPAQGVSHIPQQSVTYPTISPALYPPGEQAYSGSYTMRTTEPTYSHLDYNWYMMYDPYTIPPVTGSKHIQSTFVPLSVSPQGGLSWPPGIPWGYTNPQTLPAVVAPSVRQATFLSGRSHEDVTGASENFQQFMPMTGSQQEYTAERSFTTWNPVSRTFSTPGTFQRPSFIPPSTLPEEVVRHSFIPHRNSNSQLYRAKTINTTSGQPLPQKFNVFEPKDPFGRRRHNGKSGTDLTFDDIATPVPASPFRLRMNSHHNVSIPPLHGTPALSELHLPPTPVSPFIPLDLSLLRPPSDHNLEILITQGSSFYSPDSPLHVLKEDVVDYATAALAEQPMAHQPQTGLQQDAERTVFVSEPVTTNQSTNQLKDVRAGGILPTFHRYPPGALNTTPTIVVQKPKYSLKSIFSNVLHFFKTIDLGFLEGSNRIAIDFLLTKAYLYFLLCIPSLYYNRVLRIFKQTNMGLSEIKKMALETSQDDELLVFPHLARNRPPEYLRLKRDWEAFVDSLMREWKIFNIVSVILFSAILTVLQIPGAASNPVTRFTALLSTLCALISLLFGGVYIIRFGNMRRTYKGAEWALEIHRNSASVVWNVWILLAIPAIWLTWSIILCIISIMSFVWLESPDEDDTASLKITAAGLLAGRIVISAFVGLGIIYGGLVLVTFRRYGDEMDDAWKKRIDDWFQEKTGNPYPSGLDGDLAYWDPDCPTESHLPSEMSSPSTVRQRPSARHRAGNTGYYHPSWNPISYDHQATPKYTPPMTPSGTPLWYGNQPQPRNARNGSLPPINSPRPSNFYQFSGNASQTNNIHSVPGPYTTWNVSRPSHDSTYTHSNTRQNSLPYSHNSVEPFQPTYNTPHATIAPLADHFSTIADDSDIENLVQDIGPSQSNLNIPTPHHSIKPHQIIPSAPYVDSPNSIAGKDLHVGIADPSPWSNLSGPVRRHPAASLKPAQRQTSTQNKPQRTHGPAMEGVPPSEHRVRFGQVQLMNG